MKIFQIIGQPGAGKTTLVADLVKELISRGISTGTLKHTAHSHELDKPGKDSFIHRQAGAAPAAMVTPDLAAVYLPRTQNLGPQDILDQFYCHLDIVLIEGWISGPHEKIEIWRSCLDRPPLFSQVENVIAFVSDKNLDESLKNEAVQKNLIFFERNDVIEIADYLEYHMKNLSD